MQLWSQLVLAISFPRIALSRAVRSPSSEPLGNGVVAQNGSACRLAADPNVFLGEGFGISAGDTAPSTGVLKGFMIFIDFPDHPSTNGSNASMLYDLITREADAWFANTTYGRLKVNYAADKTRFYLSLIHI